MKALVRALTLVGLRELISEFGGKPEVLAREVGLDPRAFDQPERLISARKAHEIVNLAAATLRKPDLGLIWGARSDPSRLGPLHVALANAATGREALQLVARFLHLNFPLGAVRLAKRTGRRQYLISLRSYLPNPPPMIQFYERRVGSLHVLLGLVCGRGYKPEEVWFSHDQLSPDAAYRRVFGVLPRFGMPEAGIVIAGSTLDAVRPGANLQVRAMAVAYLESQGPNPSRSRADETRRIVEALIRSSTCSVEEAARAMGIHARTLQRDLKLEGTTFEVIRDGVRRDLARQLLRDRSQSITQVSLQLHYATASAFTRSCRRWFRNSPSRVRELLSDAPRRPGVRKKRTPVQKNGRRQ